MECCDINHNLNLQQGKKRIVITGNPNVGKSIFFNYLTNSYVNVSNYPGTTLEINSGIFGDDLVLDTPGVYGVSSFNDEEIVARDVIMSADIIVNVVDAVHLERDLFLTQQIIDMGIPVIVALNMMDEAEKRGMNINIQKLSNLLGVPVIPTIAPNKKGFNKLINSIKKACKGNSIFPKNPSLQEKYFTIYNKVKHHPSSLLIMEGDNETAENYGISTEHDRDKIYKLRRTRVNQIVDKIITIEETGGDFMTRLGRLMIKPMSGVPILLGVLYLIYKFIGEFVAQTLVDFTEGVLFAGYYAPFVQNLLSEFIKIDSIIGKILVGEFGLLTMTVTYTLGLLLPLVTGFYLILSIMEDSGYLPRVATLVDKLLNKIGLNGRAVIPMLLGFGCVTMATITTRLLGSRREKIIAVFLLGLAVPCSAQLGVIVGLISPLGPMYLILYIGVIFSVYVLSGTILNRVLPGESSDLLIDLPPLRLPRLDNVFKKTYTKSKFFIKEAGPVFAVGAIIITIIQEIGLLRVIERAVEPVVSGWLKLPKETARVFLMGIIRRDFGAAGLTDVALNPAQTTVALITITLFVPCIAAMMIMIKERSLKESLFIWIGSWVTAFGVGGIVAYII